MEQSGIDMEGNLYHSLEEAWMRHVVLNPNSAKTNKPNATVESWYEKSTDYWKQQESTVNGMLGGFEKLHEDDITESKALLQQIYFSRLNNRNEMKRIALDIGAGIGRTTKFLHCPLFDEVHLEDAVNIFVDKAQEYVNNPKLTQRICCPMQQFVPTPNTYNVIWIQWCIIYLTDDDLIQLLKRCASALNRNDPNAIIVVKDNVNVRGEFTFDVSDFSVMRSEAHMHKVFEQANLQIVDERFQVKMPPECMKVKMYTLRPKSL